MTRLRTSRSSRPWYLYAIAAAAVLIIVLGVTELGTQTSSARTSTEVVTAAKGVVQTTVSDSGNVEPGVDEDVNFGTSGTLSSIRVKVGDHVQKGELIATLNPTSAKLTLREAELSLSEARDALAEAKDGDSTASTSGSSDAETADDSPSGSDGTVAEFVSDDESSGTATGTTTDPTTTTTTGTTTTGTTTTSGTTKTGTSKSPTGTKHKTSGRSSKHSNASSEGGSSNSSSTSESDSSNSSNSGSASTTTTSAASIVSAKLSVEQAEQTVSEDEQAVKDTNLYAPVTGTIASLSDTAVGDSISSGTTGSNDTGSSSSSSSTGSTGSTGTGSTASSSSSSSAFAEIVNNHHMTMTVSLTESNVSSVKVGQVATVSISALDGVELSGKVTEISPIGTTSDDVTSYDATITIDQQNPKVLPGMSATATIVTKQVSGVTIPTDAITGTGTTGTVKVQEHGKTVSKAVVVGLRGTERAAILSGLKAGDEVVETITLPSLGTSTTSSSSSSSSTLGTSSRSFGGSGFTGGGFAGGAGFSGGGGPP